MMLCQCCHVKLVGLRTPHMRTAIWQRIEMNEYKGSRAFAQHKIRKIGCGAPSKARRDGSLEKDTSTCTQYIRVHTRRFAVFSSFQRS